MLKPSPSRPYARIAVLGGGAWGTALALVAASTPCATRLWARRADVVDDINAHRRNRAYLGDIELPAGLEATTDMAAALDGAEAVLIVTPSTTIRRVAAEAARHTGPKVPFFVCAKGIEADTGCLMAEVAAEEAPGRTIGVVSGPTFAAEVARRMPTAVTIACDSVAGRLKPEQSAAARMALTLGTEHFRPYVSDDIAGVEIGGALKNVIAIACGMAAGAGWGDNLRAAIITRGMWEMKELADQRGARRETVTGLGGVGDLILTCSSRQSRNFSYGFQFGQGVPPERMFEGKPVLVEGVTNVLTATDYARRHGLHLPIAEMVRSVIHDGVPLADAFAAYWVAPIESEPSSMDLVLAHPAAAAGAA